MRMLRTESLRVVLLDTRYRLLRVESVSLGSMNESIAHPREIFRPAITYSAYAVIVVHNHPSGDASPSQTDHSLTRRLAEAAALLQIKLLDHIIIGAPSEGNPGYFSFKEAGVLEGQESETPISKSETTCAPRKFTQLQSSIRPRESLTTRKSDRFP